MITFVNRVKRYKGGTAGVWLCSLLLQGGSQRKTSKAVNNGSRIKRCYSCLGEQAIWRLPPVWLRFDTHTLRAFRIYPVYD